MTSFDTPMIVGAENPAAQQLEALAELGQGGAVRQIQTGHSRTLALAHPRSIDKVKRDIADEAAMSGEAFLYEWEVKNKDNTTSTIKGPTIKLANAAVRCWGNCTVQLLPPVETKAAWIFTAVFVDLETGSEMPRQFRQSKNSAVYGRMDEERKADIRFQTGQSKAIRNAVVNGIPSWLFDLAIEKARSAVRGYIEGQIWEQVLAMSGGDESAAKENFKKYEAEATAVIAEKAVKALDGQGVTVDRVLVKFNVAKVSGLDVENLVRIAGDIASIRDGVDTAENLYPLVEDEKEDDEEESPTTLDEVADVFGEEPEAKPSTEEPVEPAEEEAPGDWWLDGHIESLDRNGLVDLCKELGLRHHRRKEDNIREELIAFRGRRQFVSAFEEVLREAKTSTDITLLNGQIEQALAEGKIDGETAHVLRTLVSNHASKIGISSEQVDGRDGNDETQQVEEPMGVVEQFLEDVAGARTKKQVEAIFKAVTDKMMSKEITLEDFNRIGQAVTEKKASL